MKTIIVSILFTKNNTLFSFLNFKGQVLGWTSMGVKRAKGSKKLNPATVHLIINNVVNYIYRTGYSLIHLKTNGFNKSRKNVIKALKRTNLRIITVHDMTSKPHNGCRLKTSKRL